MFVIKDELQLHLLCLVVIFALDCRLPPKIIDLYGCDHDIYDDCYLIRLERSDVKQQPLLIDLIPLFFPLFLENLS
jgi:hypothetical protein